MRGLPNRQSERKLGERRRGEAFGTCRRGWCKGEGALSVACGDSSPGGGAKGPHENEWGPRENEWGPRARNERRGKEEPTRSVSFAEQAKRA